jgi:hypothetical protein
VNFHDKKKRLSHGGDVSCAQNTENKEKQFSGVNVKQVCDWMGVSRAITQFSTSNLVAFFTHI